MSVDQVLTNTADASMDQVSPPASNFVDVGGSHGTVMSLGLVQLRHHATKKHTGDLRP